MSVEGVWQAFARLKDKAAMTRLFEPIPPSIVDNVLQGLATEMPFRGMRWDDETKRAFYVCSDGDVLGIWTLDGVATQEKAAEMWAHLDMRCEAGATLGTPLVTSVYAEVTGFELSLVN